MKEKSEVGKFGSHGLLRINIEKDGKEVLEKENRYREMLNNPKKLTMGEASEN